MNKIILILLFVFVCGTQIVFGQLGNDGSYLWNTVQINHKIGGKYEFVFTNRVFYSNISDRLDYYFLDFTGYRSLTKHFSAGLGYRRTETYKTDKWNYGNIYWMYGVIYAKTGGVKLKIANRLGYKSFKDIDSQIAFDNISTIDFFTNSTSKFPKPYLIEEVFSELKSMKVQNMKLFTGLHLLKGQHFGFDVFYAFWKSNTSSGWKDYNVYGIATKINL